MPADTIPLLGRHCDLRSPIRRLPHLMASSPPDLLPPSCDQEPDNHSVVLRPDHPRILPPMDLYINGDLSLCGTSRPSPQKSAGVLCEFEGQAVRLPVGDARWDHPRAAGRRSHRPPSVSPRSRAWACVMTPSCWLRSQATESVTRVRGLMGHKLGGRSPSRQACVAKPVDNYVLSTPVPPPTPRTTSTS